VSFSLPLTALSTLSKLSIHNYEKQSKEKSHKTTLMWAADPSPVLTSGNWTHEGFVKAVSKMVKIFRAHLQRGKWES